ncbi:hypothetical protein SKAU_G00052530 [Synaphobranchus kaupii]|uniref:Uncharacterized protein n=1 Tax=Synaphobranchus kaupii TaxID=118154 RepID=A0A9Q1J9K7_SYNKA|nr:hypothetical protein SKAU_G00052530 [Synaphobranchus kaupii]
MGRRLKGETTTWVFIQRCAKCFFSNLFTFLSLGSAHFTALLVYSLQACMLQSGPSVCTSNLSTSLARTLPWEYCMQH